MLVPVLAERKQWQRSAWLVRLAQLVAGLAVLLLTPHARPLLTVVMLLGLLGAMVSPARTGQLIVLAAGIAGWVFGYGPHGSPPVARVLAFAVALFLLHDSTSLASTVPLTAELRPEALFGWLRRSAVTLLVAGVLIGVVYGVGLLPGDVAIHGELLEARGGLAHAAARWFDYGGKWEVLAPAMLALFAWSATARRHWWLWCLLMPAGGAVEQLFKPLVGRPRPRGVNMGFPSGHVTAAATFAVLLFYVLSRERASPGVRLGLGALAVALVILVGFARVILNAHWPSDVLGGMLLGGGCAAAGAWWDSTRAPAPGSALQVDA